MSNVFHARVSRVLFSNSSKTWVTLCKSSLCFSSECRIFLLSTKELIQQAFQLLGSMPAVSFKNKGENLTLQILNVWLFLCSSQSNLGCPDCLPWVWNGGPASSPLQNTSPQVCCPSPSAAIVSCVPKSCKRTSLLLSYLSLSVYSHFLSVI